MKVVLIAVSAWMLATSLVQAQDKSTKDKIQQFVAEYVKGEEALASEQTGLQREKAITKFQNDLRAIVKDQHLVLRFTIADITKETATSKASQRSSRGLSSGRTLYKLAVRGPLGVLRESEDRATWINTLTIPLDRTAADTVKPGDILEVSGGAHVGRGGQLQVLAIKENADRPVNGSGKKDDNVGAILFIQAPQYRVTKPTQEEIDAFKNTSADKQK